MAILIIVIFVFVGVLEISLWNERPLKETITYIVLLCAGAILSVLIYYDPYLPVPAPVDWLFESLKNLF